MKIQYIYHSGFLVETDACYYLFDYYMGDLPLLKPEKPILVFASHRHKDHYNPAVFDLLKGQGMQQITAVLAKDIPPKKYPADIECIPVYGHKTYELPHQTTLRTLLSTDAGVAFLITCPEGTIFHAGDLNDWVWKEYSEQANKQMTGRYRYEINLLADTPIDVAFLPLDGRLEEYYDRGLLYFLKKVSVQTVYPMHYWEKPEIISRFLTEHPEYSYIIQYTEKDIK